MPCQPSMKPTLTRFASRVPAPLAIITALLLLPGISRAADSAVSFLEQHCYDCHDAEMKKGDMPPKKKKQPDPTVKVEFLAELDPRLVEATSAGEFGRVRIRRMMRVKFQNSLQDLLALPRFDIVGLLPSD